MSGLGFFKTKRGEPFEVRRGTAADAVGIFQLSREVIGEEIYQLTSSSEFKLSLEDEIAWIDSIVANQTGLLLVAIKHGMIIGILDFHAGHRTRISHTGEFGMSISKDSRNDGVGSALL